MNRRINKIIMDILHQKKHTLNDYSLLFDVSNQTIRNDIKEINSAFSNKKLKVTIDDNGAIITNNNLDLFEVLETFNSFQNYRLSQEERRIVLSLLLIMSNQYLTTYYLSEYVLVSRNTLLKDMEEVKKWLKKNGIELLSSLGKGYKVNGEEMTLRIAMLKLLVFNGLFDRDYNYANGFENNIFQGLLLEIIDQDKIYNDVNNILLENEKILNIELSDYSYQEVICYLIIMIERIKNKKMIKEEEILRCEFQTLNKSSKYEFACNLISAIVKKYGLKICYSEYIYLTSILRSKSYIKNNASNIDSIEIQVLINEFIFEISKKMNIKYFLNNSLFEILENHLKLLIYRIKIDDSIENVLFEQIYHNYSDVFPIVKASLKNIENYVGRKMSSNELSFIVLHVVAILENNDFSLNKRTIKVGLICNSGRGTSQLLKVKLKNLFPEVEITRVTSSHSALYLNFDNEDVLLSTIGIEATTIPVLVVNPILKEIDIRNIRNVLEKIKRERNSLTTMPFSFDSIEYNYYEVIKKYVSSDKHDQLLTELQKINFELEISTQKDQLEIKRLSDILNENRVIMDQSAKNWQEAIRLSALPLLKENMIDQLYIENMINLVDKYDSYIVISPGIALPHAEPTDGVKGVGATFLRLTHPVSFNHQLNDPVKYVIALSIPQGINLGTCLYYFTELLVSENFLERMNEANDTKEIIKNLVDMENRVMRVL